MLIRQFNEQEDDEDANGMEKRAWNQLQGSWGKRAPLAHLLAGYKRNWSNLRGAWGKREMPLTAGKMTKGQSTISSISNIFAFLSNAHLLITIRNDR